MKRISLIVLDVDGTLTDGKILIGSNGLELKSFNVKDGMGISLAVKAGISVAIITGRESEIVTRRAKELKIPYVYQGVSDKAAKLFDLMSEVKSTPEEIAFIGDDLNDISAMEAVGFAACPADACSEVKQMCQFISKYNGGEGAVREIIEHILNEQGAWNENLLQFGSIKQ